MHWLAFRRATLLGLSTAASLSLTATALLAPAPASASEDTPCPYSGALCLFEGPDFTGEMWNVMAWPPGGSGTCVNLPEHGWGDRAVSAINTGPYTASLFLNEDCEGGPYPIGPGEWVSPLGFAPRSVWVY
ncbi:peptidase inhibitor family I36 protein [Myxococcus sp. Y35]|uniref:peptidase inhibitor family I36 protein n=1 Tax=Pseudomyxococcus flavus TaxID=3115648 RepID=UPI003CECFC53